MSKVLHVLVYVFLGLAGAALWFELQLNEKRSELTDRNRMQEDYLVKIARTIEKADPDKSASFEIKRDSSPVEAKIVDAPDMENVLSDYPAPLEQANLETYNWENSRSQLRAVYVLDADGKPVMDGNEPLKRGRGTEDEMLSQLFESAKTQQSRLNSTRAALGELREKLAAAVAEVNRLKPPARQSLITIEEQKTRIARLEEEKTGLENQITKIKGQIDELNGEITSLRDEVSAAKDDVAAAKDEVEKRDKLIESLKTALKTSIQTRSVASAGTGSTASTTSIPVGDKGKIVVADNESMFVIVSFSEDAIKELKGEKPDAPLPALEFGVKRPGYAGAAGEFVGRIRIRQEVKGKNYAICDILGNWEQDKLAKGDVVFAD